MQNQERKVFGAPMQAAMDSLERVFGTQHPEYSRVEHRREVECGDSRLWNYWEWVVHQLEADGHNVGEVVAAKEVKNVAEWRTNPSCQTEQLLFVDGEEMGCVWPGWRLGCKEQGWQSREAGFFPLEAEAKNATFAAAMEKLRLRALADVCVGQTGSRKLADSPNAEEYRRRR